MSVAINKAVEQSPMVLVLESLNAQVNNLEEDYTRIATKLLPLLPDAPEKVNTSTSDPAPPSFDSSYPLVNQIGCLMTRLHTVHRDFMSLHDRCGL